MRGQPPPLLMCFGVVLRGTGPAAYCDRTGPLIGLVPTVPSMRWNASAGFFVPALRGTKLHECSGEIRRCREQT